MSAKRLKKRNSKGMKKKNVTIQIIRIVAMSMILLDHILGFIDYPGHQIMQQFFNSAVFIFLFISGCLFGSHTIKDWIGWLKKRIIRICIPMWIVMIVTMITEYIVWNKFSIIKIVVYILNLQGILGTTIASGALWFLTLIMICYIITPFLQWTKNKNNIKLIFLIISVCAIVQVVTAYITDVGMMAGHSISWCVLAIGIYMIGYFFGDRILKKSGISKIILFTVLMSVISIIAIIANRMIDGTIIYDRVISCYGFAIIDLWICVTISYLFDFIKKIVPLRLINHFDGLSYEIYLVHNYIIYIVTMRFIKEKQILLFVILTFVVSYIMAILLKIISNKVINITRGTGK